MKHLRTVILALSVTAFAQTAQAQLVVQGEGDAAICYQHTLTGNQGSRSTLQTCSNALKQFNTNKDEAATYVNRGVLYMRRGDQVRASADYKAALDIMPNLTEAHINFAASLIRQDKLDDALIALNTALADADSTKRPEALFNRAIILDRKENYRGAYKDLKAALVLRPEWEPAISMISRYEVQPAG